MGAARGPRAVIGARSFFHARGEGRRMEKRDLQDRTEADERTAEDHVPLAQAEGKEKKEKTPGPEDHSAGGQGLSG